MTTVTAVTSWRGSKAGEEREKDLHFAVQFWTLS
jgi:hypothetical protein